MLRSLSYIGILIFSFGLTATGQDVMFDDIHPQDGAIYLKNVHGTAVPHNHLGQPIMAHAAFRMNPIERAEAGLATRIGSSGVLTGSRSESGPTFNLTYLDVANNTNTGFDDPTEGAQRRAALEAAFQYYASIILDNGEADIEIRESFSANPNANPFAFSAAYYFGSKGFNSPFTKHHIVSGSDPYGAYPDGYIQFNFHDGFNYQNGVSSDPAGDQFDFYTITSHEILHILGLTS